MMLGTANNSLGVHPQITAIPPKVHTLGKTHHGLKTVVYYIKTVTYFGNGLAATMPTTDFADGLA